jgi:hypothetical protein
MASGLRGELNIDSVYYLEVLSPGIRSGKGKRVRARDLLALRDRHGRAHPAREVGIDAVLENKYFLYKLINCLVKQRKSVINRQKYFKFSI